MSLFDLKNQKLIYLDLLERSESSVNVEDSQKYLAARSDLEKLSSVGSNVQDIHAKLLDKSLLLESNDTYVANFYRTKAKKNLNLLIHLVLKNKKEEARKQLSKLDKLAFSFEDVFVVKSLLNLRKNEFSSKDDVLEELEKINKNAIFSLFFKEKNIIGFCFAFFVENYLSHVFQYSNKFVNFSEQKELRVIQVLNHMRYLVKEEMYVDAYALVDELRGLGGFEKMANLLKINAVNQMTFDTLNEYLI